MTTYKLPPGAIEAAARKIAPGRWAVFDESLTLTKRQYRDQSVGWPEDQFKDRESIRTVETAIQAALAWCVENGHARATESDWQDDDIFIPKRLVIDLEDTP